MSTKTPTTEELLAQAADAEERARKVREQAKQSEEDRQQREAKAVEEFWASRAAVVESTRQTTQAAHTKFLAAVENGEEITEAWVKYRQARVVSDEESDVFRRWRHTNAMAPYRALEEEWRWLMGEARIVQPTLTATGTNPRNRAPVRLVETQSQPDRLSEYNRRLAAYEGRSEYEPDAAPHMPASPPSPPSSGVPLDRKPELFADALETALRTIEERRVSEAKQARTAARDAAVAKASSKG